MEKESPIAFVVQNKEKFIKRYLPWYINDVKHMNYDSGDDTFNITGSIVFSMWTQKGTKETFDVSFAKFNVWKENINLIEFVEV